MCVCCPVAITLSRYCVSWENTRTEVTTSVQWPNGENIKGRPTDRELGDNDNLGAAGVGTPIDRLEVNERSLAEQAAQSCVCTHLSKANTTRQYRERCQEWQLSPLVSDSLAVAPTAACITFHSAFSLPRTGRPYRRCTQWQVCLPLSAVIGLPFFAIL